MVSLSKINDNKTHRTMKISKDVIIESAKGFNIMQGSKKCFSVVDDYGYAYFATDTLRKAQNWLKRQQ